MRIRILTITHKSPDWIEAGYAEYAKRLPKGTLELIEIPAEKRTATIDIKKIIAREGEKIIAAIKPNHDVIALDVKGKLFSTEQLAEQFTHWQQEGRHIDLLIGGPDGLSAPCLQIAKEKWSLSPLTFPHFLVRVLVAEQIYRAMSVLQNKPYHR